MKHFIFCLLALLTSSGLFAQLHVEGNHFVFATDVQLFVTQVTVAQSHNFKKSKSKYPDSHRD